MFGRIADIFDKKDDTGGEKEDESSQLQMSVESLRPADKEGYITKKGLKFKTWKRRLFVLKGDKAWYFGSPTDTSAKGFILLTPKTQITIDEAQKKKKIYMLLIKSKGAK